MAVVSAAWAGFAQTGRITVSGTVVDDAGPVVGATVMVKGQPALGGQVTGQDGSFVISIAPGQTLQVSCLGYKPAEKTFRQAGDWYVVLEEDAVMLDEVIAVGYGVQKRKASWAPFPRSPAKPS